MSDWKESALQYKYAELPETPRYKKKKKKLSVRRSDHKHRYACSIFDCGDYTYYKKIKRPYYYIGTYCVICGRINNMEADRTNSNYNLPIFKIDDIFAKSINLEDISVS